MRVVKTAGTAVQVRRAPHINKLTLNTMQIINGKCPSKSNCYRIITQRDRTGKAHGSLAKTDALMAYERSFYLQCSQYRNRQIKGLFELYINVFYDSQRPDLDNCLKVVLDCLQSCGAIKNDRNCVKIVAQKYIDKEKPRIEFELKEV